jgi:hypothetical protein
MRLYNKNYYDVLKTIENDTIDLVFCNFYNTNNKDVWIELKRVLKLNGVVILLDELHTDKQIIELKADWYKYKIKYENIFFRRFINIYVFKKREPIIDIGNNEVPERVIDNLANCSIRSNNTEYDNDKPTDLIEYILDLYTKPKNNILDLQMDLGASARVSFLNNMDYIGCEIDKTKYEIVLNRFRTIKKSF